jgi:hypothetical protein
VQQALQLQTQGQDVNQETHSNDKREVTGYRVLPNQVQACTNWSLAETVRLPRGRQILVVRRRRQEGPGKGTPHPPLQPVGRPATGTMEGGVQSDGLESGQMQTREDL